MNAREPNYRNGLSSSFNILTKVLVKSGDVVAASKGRGRMVGAFLKVRALMSGASDDKVSGAEGFSRAGMGSG